MHAQWPLGGMRLRGRSKFHPYGSAERRDVRSYERQSVQNPGDACTRVVRGV